MTQEKKDWAAKIIAYSLIGVVGIGSGAGGSYYMQGKQDTELIQSIESLKTSKVDADKFQKMEGLVIDIAVNICKLRSTTDPASESNCERIRYDYYNRRQ